MSQRPVYSPLRASVVWRQAAAGPVKRDAAGTIRASTRRGRADARSPGDAVAQTPCSVRAARDDSVMAQNFIDCDREQAFLMPPSLRAAAPAASGGRLTVAVL